MSEKIKVFVSYAHEDTTLLQELDNHLSLLQRQGIIQEWHDRNISAGTDWNSEIDVHLNDAQIILLLISSDFLNSDYCYSYEMERAMQKHRDGSARVIPIILRPVDWEGTPFSNLQALPMTSKPVSSWKGRDGRDRAFSNISSNIRKIAQELEGDALKETGTSLTKLSQNTASLNNSTSSPSTSPLRSIESTIPVPITFVSKLQSDVDIYWLDFGGNEVFYFHLEPGKTCSQRTFVSHPWRAKDKDGNVLKEFTTTKDTQLVTLSPNTSPVRSIESSIPVVITFSNATQSDVDIYWLDWGGNEVFYFHLEPGKTCSQRTFVSHPWRAKDKDGNVLKEFTTTKDTQLVTLQ